VSTYGVAAVIDLHGTRSLDHVLDGVARLGGVAWLAPVVGPWQRVTAAFGEISQVDTVAGWLLGGGTARAAIAEDYDEYGALWVVLASADSRVDTVHRRYVLNADPNDPDDVAMAVAELGGVDPRTEDVAGSEAASDAAVLFDVEPAAMVAAESEADRAYREIGVVGGPFPWWRALRLPWPEPGAGVLVAR
jgi:hypothetical protein